MFQRSHDDGFHNSSDEVGRMEKERKKPRSIFPEDFQIMSGSGLKIFACMIMLIDHTGSIILRYCPWAQQVMFQFFNTNVSWYRIARDIGRMAFPIFCFLLVEGFEHTRNRMKYGRNLFLFALISEIPWDLWHFQKIFSMEKQNVFFTLLLGYLGLCIIEYFADKEWIQLFGILSLLAAAYYLHADYGWKGYVFILLMYCLRYYKAAQAVAGSCWLVYEWKACVAFIPINLYNGERGFIQGKFAKYFFYAFYPLHIMILFLIRKITLGI